MRWILTMVLALMTTAVVAADTPMHGPERSSALAERVVIMPGVDRPVVDEGARARRPLGRASEPLALDRATLLSDWNNLGGNAQRNGGSAIAGPTSPTLLWENDDDPSIISWHPVILGSRAFAIRESGFPNSQANDILVAYDLATGSELWRTTVPYAGDPDEEWIAYVAGANGDRVYAARGGSSRTTPVHAFDVVTGALAWSSDYETVAGPYDGVVFAEDGDLVVGDFDTITRIDATDGSTVWSTARSCQVSGSCGAALSANGVFVDEAVFGGQVVAKYDLSSGDFLYESPVMEAGFVAQNTPFVSRDGSTVYFARASNSGTFDRLYAFDDTGSALVGQWDREIRWTTNHQQGIGADGSIYLFLPGDEFVRLDPATGDVTGSAGVLSPIGSSLSPSTAIGADGTVYVSNGWTGIPTNEGRVWAFPADLSSELFSLTLDSPNIGGPSLGPDGTLVVADLTSVRAYRTSGPTLSISGTCPGDVELEVAEMTPDGDVAIIFSAAVGSSEVPVGPCAGTPLALDSPSLFSIFQADASGTFAIQRSAPAGVCGRFLQALDLETCQTTGTDSVP